MPTASEQHIMEEKAAIYDGVLLPQNLDVISEPDTQKEDRTIWYHLRTLYLFTRSDFKTVVMPQSLFAISAVLSQATTADRPTGEVIWPLLRQVAARLPHMLGWILLHLLAVDMGNQRLPGSVVEDAKNKPWRPMPAGRLTVGEAQRLLRIVVPTAVAVSTYLGAFTPTVSMMTLIWMYNELGGSGSGGWVRNAIDAAGLACFDWGAIAVLLQGHGQGQGGQGGRGQWHLGQQQGFAESSEIPRAWILLTAVVVTTTIYAQDFPDEEGDSVRGRHTVPLVYGERWSRRLLAALVLLWSVVCPAFWGASLASPAAFAAPLALGAAMATLTLLQRGQAADEAVWKMWCLWTTVLYLLPLAGHPGAPAARVDLL